MNNAKIITEYDGFRLKNKDWFKHLTRDVSLIIIFYTESAYIDHFSDFGLPAINEIIYEAKNDVLNVWRPRKKFDVLVRKIKDKAAKDPKWALDALKETDKVSKATERFCSRDISGIKKDSAEKLVSEFDSVFSDYTKYYILMVCIGYAKDEHGLALSKDAEKLFEKNKQRTLFRVMEDQYIRLGRILFGDKCKLIRYITFYELSDMIKKGKLSISIAEERQKRYLYYGTKKKKYILTGDDAEKVYDMLMKNRIDMIEPGKLKGTPAFQGKVSGRVFIAVTEEDYKKAKEEDILVTPTATPWLTPFLGKVKAIIAEEGGMSSHTAIVSRERKVPCIVGVKGATEMLKTGDEIEVDAFKGTVRKIK
jgi:phosphohistidine swiveling domain-containing protein